MNLGSVIAGLLFIVLGVLFLLDNLDVIEVNLGTLWPVLLIAVGVAVLAAGLRRRSAEPPSTET